MRGGARTGESQAISDERVGLEFSHRAGRFPTGEIPANLGNPSQSIKEPAGLRFPHRAGWCPTGVNLSQPRESQPISYIISRVGVSAQCGAVSARCPPPHVAAADVCRDFRSGDGASSPKRGALSSSFSQSGIKPVRLVFPHRTGRCRSGGCRISSPVFWILQMYRGTSDPGMDPYRPRMALALV